MHLDQSALGILRKAEDKNGRKYMDWRIPYMDQPGLIMVYKSDSRYEKYMIYFLQVRQAIVRANICTQPTEVSRWKMVH